MLYHHTNSMIVLQVIKYPMHVFKIALKRINTTKKNYTHRIEALQTTNEILQRHNHQRRIWLIPQNTMQLLNASELLRGTSWTINLSIPIAQKEQFKRWQKKRRNSNNQEGSAPSPDSKFPQDLIPANYSNYAGQTFPRRDRIKTPPRVSVESKFAVRPKKNASPLSRGGRAAVPCDLSSAN